jgi:hypothetical protein
LCYQKNTHDQYDRDGQNDNKIGQSQFAFHWVPP